jgi:hypothetical protein
MRGGRLAATAVIAAGALATMMPPASADTGQGRRNGDPGNWGNVLPNAGCAQANAWIVGVRGVLGLINTRLFEVHSPPTQDAPETRGAGKDLVNIPFIGVASAFFNRALTNRVPGNPGEPDIVPKKCAAYAEAGGASVDIGIPFIPNPIPGRPQLSLIGFHVEGLVARAETLPGKPAKMSSTAGAAYFSTLGNKIIDVPLTWPPNFGLRIPPDYNLPELALATTNEEVTTNADGTPTLNAKGQYAYDDNATSGYVNLAHVSALGAAAADVTVAHAAALRTTGGVVVSPTPTTPDDCLAPVTGKRCVPITVTGVPAG